MFVSSEDFLDIPYVIPNQEETRGLDSFIEAEETKILKKILGIELYNEFIQGLESSGDIEQKWIDLRDGATYEYGEVQYQYEGLKDLLKPYIYQLAVQLNYRKLTTSGVVINRGQQNTETQNPNYEVVTYWNEFVSKVGKWCEMKNTLYGFLYANEADYESLEFTEQHYKNQLDL